MQLLKMLSVYEHDFYSSGEMFKADMGGLISDLKVNVV